MRIVSTAIPEESLSSFIRQVLKPELPYSLPLYRRCQYHATQQTVGPEVWFATATDQPENGVHLHDIDSLVSSAVGKHWLAVYLDLRNAGQTQVWTFASWEATYSASPDPTCAVRESHELPIYRRLFDALFEHMQRDQVPKLARDPPHQWQRLKDSGKIISLPFSRSKVLFGTLAECHWLFLDDYGVTGEQKGISREDKGYLKYIITLDSSPVVTEDGPRQLRFAPMPEELLQTILDRSSIPRTLETLRQMHNVGLFDEKDIPVAWGMLGKDASISSLHTEPQYRRQGLAEAISRRLLSDQTKLFVEDMADASADRVIYAHADVSTTNLASRKVMEKLGAKVMWKVAWIEVELGEDS